MQTSEYLFLSLFLLIGSLSLIAAIFNFNWFYSSEHAKPFVNWFGPLGARMFYGILGILLIVCGLVGLFAG